MADPKFPAESTPEPGLDLSSDALRDAGGEFGDELCDKLIIEGVLGVVKDVVKERMRERHGPTLTDAEQQEENRKVRVEDDEPGKASPETLKKFGAKTREELGVTQEEWDNALPYSEAVRRGWIEPK
jgi:hypothetical protein